MSIKHKPKIYVHNLGWKKIKYETLGGESKLARNCPKNTVGTEYSCSDCKRFLCDG